MLQIRPSGSGGVYYSPERDVAYIGAGMLRQAKELLEFLLVREEWIKKYCRENNIEEETVKACADAFIDTVYHDCKNVDRRSITAYEPKVQMLYTYCLSLIFLGAFVHGWKEAHSAGYADGMQKKDFIEESMKYVQFVKLKPSVWARLKAKISTMFDIFWRRKGGRNDGNTVRVNTL